MMNTMGTLNGNNGDRRKGRIVLIALSGLTLAAVGTTAYLWVTEQDHRSALDERRLHAERLLGEKLQLEKRVAESNGQLSEMRAANSEAELRLQELQHRLDDARQRETTLAARAQRTLAAERKAKEMTEAQGDLLSQLSLARSHTQDLEQRIAELLAERDALAARLGEQQQGAWMVNNAVVEAVRGRKGLLTVKARRTREIRMAFDLPQRLAPDANFRIVTPEGLSYAGADPALSMTLDLPEGDALAAVDLAAGMLPEDRATRVHLKFDPQQKLKPGVYRIDVRSGEQYLNTVLLRLR